MMFSKSLLCFSMLLIFYLVICSSTNTSLFSCFFDNSRMAYILFWFYFSCSFDHVLLTFFPSYQFPDKLKIHNCNPIDRFPMICFRIRHGRFIVKMLHVIFFIDNWQNCCNSINILWPHFFYNPPSISVISIWDSISYVY